jgi:hypothetical protein
MEKIKKKDPEPTKSLEQENLLKPKYSFSKKLNLSRIAKDIWPFEEEIYTISDAESFADAVDAVDTIYQERESYLREMANLIHLAMTKTVPAAPINPPVAAPLPFPPAPPTTPYTPVSGPPIGAPTNTGGGITNQPPAGF